MESLLLEFGGLPLHPLVVHAAVVFIPLAALLLIASAIILRWRWLLPTAVLVSWVATAFSILASQSGEALGEVIGTPQEHGELGEAMSPLMIGMSLIATLTWWLRKRSSKLLRGLSQLASVVIALVALGLVVLVGHSGAVATWNGTLTAPETVASSEESDVVATNSEQNTVAAPAGGITMEDVATHNSVDDCWIVVDGVVYDASGFGARHPGGQAAIQGICGTDATNAFRGQHGTGGSPNTQLASFEIGLLAG